MSNTPNGGQDIPDQSAWDSDEMHASSLRDILAANLRRIIASDTPPGERPSVRKWAMDRELDVRLIDRLTKSQHAVTLDKIDAIAEACKLKPWQLLLEDLDPKAPPDAPISEEDRALLRKLRRLIAE